MKYARLISSALMVALVVGCATMTIDTAIKYRSQFNTLLAQFNTEIATLPVEQQREWAAKAIPIVSAGNAALTTMDIVSGSGGSITPENVQQFLAAKNQLIDLIANMMLAKKGGK